MRVLFVSFIADSDATGMGRWTHRVAGELAGRGHQVTLWFADQFSRTSRMGRFALLTFPVVLLDALRKNKGMFDVVVAHEASAAAVALARRMDKGLPPLVTMCHNVESKVWIRMKEAHRRGLASVAFASRVKTPLLRTSQSDFAIRTADRVVCLSHEDRRYIVEGLHVKEDKVHVTANGVDRAATESPDGSSKRGSGKVLFIGGWLDVKGKEVLKRILATAAPGSISLTLAGTGADEATVTADIPHGHDIEVIPRFDQPVLRRLLSDHDVLLMPSLSEGSPLSLLEGMSAGLVPVAARTGGIPDIVQNGINGYLFDPFEPETVVPLLNEILADDQARQQLSDSARERAAEFTWERTADTLEIAMAQAANG